jgi:hypothetical protein
MNSPTVYQFKQILEEHFGVQFGSVPVQKKGGEVKHVPYAMRKGAIAAFEFESDSEYVASSVVSSIANRLGIVHASLDAALESVRLRPED